MKKVLIVLLFMMSILSITPIVTQATVHVPIVGKLGEQSSYEAATFSTDGRYIATMTYGGNIDIWNAHSLAYISSLEHSSSYSTHQLLYANDDMYLYALAGNKIALFDIASGNKLFTTTTYFDAKQMQLNHDETILYVLTNTQLLFLNASTGETLHTFTLNSGTVSFDINETTNELAIAFTNGDIQLRNATTGDYIRVLQTTSTTPQNKHTIMYTADGKTMFSHRGVSNSSQLPVYTTIYDVTNNYTAVPLQLNGYSVPEAYLYNTQLAPNENYTFFSTMTSINWSNVYRLSLFDTVTQQLITQIPLERPASTNVIAINPTTTRLVYGNTVYDLTQIPKRTATGISFAPTTSIVGLNNTQSIDVIQTYSDGYEATIPLNEVTLRTSNRNVVAIIGQKLQGVGTGTATITATYGNSTATMTVEVRDYEESPLVANIEPTKIWNVVFNQAVKVSTIQQKSIYVTNEAGDMVPMLYYVEQTAPESVQVMPVSPYTSGETYTLWIKDVRASTGLGLAKYMKKDFTIK